MFVFFYGASMVTAVVWVKVGKKISHSIDREATKSSISLYRGDKSVLWHVVIYDKKSTFSGKARYKRQ